MEPTLWLEIKLNFKVNQFIPSHHQLSRVGQANFKMYQLIVLIWDYELNPDDQASFFVLSYSLPLLLIVCLYSAMLHTLWNKVGVMCYVPCVMCL